MEKYKRLHEKLEQCYKENWPELSLIVCAWVGKEFPDMRQNERRIEFIKVGEAVRTFGCLKREWTLLWAYGQFLQPNDKENSNGEGWH